MSLDHTQIQDVMTKSTEYWQGKKNKDLLKPKSREDLLGLKFKTGDHVKDTVTNTEVEIIGGTREVVTYQGPES